MSRKVWKGQLDSLRFQEGLKGSLSVLEVPKGSKRFKEGVEGSMMVRILLDPTRPFWTLLEPPGILWNLPDPFGHSGPSLTF